MSGPVSDHVTCNVAAEMEDPSSMLSLYRNLITLRRTRLALSLGEIEAVATGQDLLSYQRRFGSEVLKIVLNFAHASRSISVGSGRVLLSTFGKHEREATDGLLVLGPDEGVIVDVDQCAGA